VTFDRSDPDRLKVRWDDVADSAEASQQQAEALAAQLNQGGSGPVVSAGGDVSEIVAALQQQFPGAQVQVGDGQVVSGPSAGTAGDDRIEELERLAKLKESGALTEEEFEREKARILGEG
jgi:Short C-terminal domain